MLLLEQRRLRYCRLRDLSPFNRPDSGRVSVVVKSYFDGSGAIGHPSAKTLVLAGYAASEGLWTQFELRWVQLLEKHNIRYLHMRDIYPHRDPASGKMLGWSIERVKALVYDAILLLNDLDPERSDLFGYSCIVSMDDYRRYQQAHPAVKEAETICVEACIGTLLAERAKERNGLQIYFDKDEPFLKIVDQLWHRPKATRPWWAHRVSMVAPVSQKDVLPIQAADLLAWLSNRHFSKDDVEQLMLSTWLASPPRHAIFDYDRLVLDFGA